MENFEEILNRMNKPDITRLKHSDLLVKAIASSKDKSVVSFWWLLIPLYAIAAMMMKSLYIPQSPFRYNLHQFEEKEGHLSLLLFLLLPLLLIVINLLTIKKIYYLSGSPKTTEFLIFIWNNILVILISILLLIFYFI